MIYREVIIDPRKVTVDGVIRVLNKEKKCFETLVEHQYEGDHIETLLEDFLLDNPEYKLAAKYHVQVAAQVTSQVTVQVTTLVRRLVIELVRRLVASQVALWVMMWVMTQRVSLSIRLPKRNMATRAQVIPSATPNNLIILPLPYICPTLQA